MNPQASMPIESSADPAAVPRNQVSRDGEDPFLAELPRALRRVLASFAGIAARARSEHPGGLPPRRARAWALLPPLRRKARVGSMLLLSAGISAFSRVLQSLTVGPGGAGPAALPALRRRLVALLEEEWRDLEDGVVPRAAAEVPWRAYAAGLPLALADLLSVWRRVRNRRFEDLDPAAHPERYPRYFARNFHYQSQGYLGHRSAELYDLQVEILFGGVADAMRRRALRPIVEFLRARPPGAEPLRIIDVACGTGRLLAMLGATVPGARLFGLDLSPHYIAYARAHLPRVLDVSLVAENAESLPFPDGYFDVVTSTYLFHEVPGDVRARALAEMARVLRPGGLAVLADSLQLRDAPDLDSVLRDFPARYHEPYFTGYVQEDLAERARAAGLAVQATREAFLTKIVVARRPIDSRARV